MKKLIYLILIILLCMSSLALISCNRKYSIDYELDGGINSTDNPGEYKTGDVFELSIPTKEGYMFAGWYTDSEFKNFITEIKEDSVGKIKLYAKWIDIEENISFELNEDSYKVIGCNDSLEYLFIPSIYNGLPVASIDADAFKNHNNLKYVHVPDGITSIGKSAFEFCINLTKINLPDGIAAIGMAAFRDCAELKSIVIPKNVTYISNYTFSGCSKLETVEFHDEITYIGMWSFMDCISLASVEIPDSVTRIVDSAFKNCVCLESVKLSKGITVLEKNIFDGCVRLKSIEIHEGITTIEENVFRGCQSLKVISIPKSVNKISTNYHGAFYGCSGVMEYIVAPENQSYKSVDGVLYNKSGDTLIRYPSAKQDKTVVISNEVKKISGAAFFYTKHLESIVLPDDLDSIGQCAFYECYKLQEINIPGKLRSIGGDAFRGCISLTSIVIPSSVTRIDTYAFYGCSSLTVFCESPSKPHYWDNKWVEENTGVVWNYNNRHI